jgi:hypothetical protein
MDYHGSMIHDPLDVSEALRLWDDLFQANLKLALSTGGDRPEERRAARERLLEGWRRSLVERDRALARMVTCLEAASREP